MSLLIIGCITLLSILPIIFTFDLIIVYLLKLFPSTKKEFRAKTADLEKKLEEFREKTLMRHNDLLNDSSSNETKIMERVLYGYPKLHNGEFDKFLEVIKPVGEEGKIFSKIVERIIIVAKIFLFLFLHILTKVRQCFGWNPESSEFLFLFLHTVKFRQDTLDHCKAVIKSSFHLLNFRVEVLLRLISCIREKKRSDMEVEVIDLLSNTMLKNIIKPPDLLRPFSMIRAIINLRKEPLEHDNEYYVIAAESIVNVIDILLASFLLDEENLSTDGIESAEEGFERHFFNMMVSFYKLGESGIRHDYLIDKQQTCKPKLVDLDVLALKGKFLDFVKKNSPTNLSPKEKRLYIVNSCKIILNFFVRDYKTNHEQSFIPDDNKSPTPEDRYDLYAGDTVRDLATSIVKGLSSKDLANIYTLFSKKNSVLYKFEEYEKCEKISTEIENSIKALFSRDTIMPGLYIVLEELNKIVISNIGMDISKCEILPPPSKYSITPVINQKDPNSYTVASQIATCQSNLDRSK